jgi:hypothetical protein
MERSRFADQSLERLSPGGAASKIALKTKNRRLPFESGIHPTSSLILEESYEKAVSAFQVVTTVMGAAGLVYAGYIFLNALPDLRRYIRISTM